MLARVADLDPPKAAVYFADTMRSNAGGHYLSFFGEADRRNSSALIALELDALGGANPFQNVIDEASAHGIRLYTVQAQGLTLAPSRFRSPPRAVPRAGTISGAQQRGRIYDAQDSLVGLAAESGGKPFLNGVRAAKIANRRSSRTWPACT